MFGNNIGGPFIMPGNMSYGPMMYGAPTIGRTMLRNAPIMGARGGLGSLLGIGRAAGTGARSLNIGGLLNNASKALGVVNQMVPIVKEVGPMMNNMRSMLKIASIFKDETDTNKSKETSKVVEEKKEVVDTTNTKENSTSINNDSTTKYKSSINNEPNFFL